MAVVSVSLPQRLLDQADAFLEGRGFDNRSELLRAALRDFLQREPAAPREGERHATLTLVYPGGSERRMSDLRHGFGDLVRGMVHGHAGERITEVFVLAGHGERIQRFADILRADPETRLLQLTWVDAP